MFMPILSGKVSSNRPWNHETENYSLLKLYRLLRKNTVGIWLEINLASTKTKLSSDFHGGNHILVQEKPEGILFKPDCQRVGATPPNSLSVWHMFTWVINLNCSEERKTSLVYVDWEHSGEKIIEHHFLRPLKQWNICKCSIWRVWRNPQFLGRARFCLFRGMVHEETHCLRAGGKGSLHFQSSDSVSGGWKAFF